VAHTLTAYYYTDPATAVTVDFYGAVSDNDGIAVDSYEMGIPGIEQARNNSLYSDSSRPVYSRHGTVTDVLTVTVRGSTNTNLYTNLHLLAKLGEYARMAAESRNESHPAYMKFKPGGSAAGEVLYAVIYDCRVQLPAGWANTQDATLTIDDVVVTIERTMWQADAPISYVQGAGGNTANIALTGQAFASSASSSANVGGDTSALRTLTMFHDIGSTTGQIDRVIVGYRSKNRGGSQYAALGKKEAESATMGTDASAVADATASNGNVAQCTFATTTTDAIRISGSGIPWGTHRVYMRAKITSTAVASVYVKHQSESLANGAVFISGEEVTVSSTSYLVYDMGIVRYFQEGYGNAYEYTGHTGFYQVFASLASGSGNLDIDWLYFMPTEGFVTAKSLGIGTSNPTAKNIFLLTNGMWQESASVFYSGATTTYGSTAKVSYTSSFDPIPGPFALYWLVGTDSGSEFDVGIHASLTVSLATNPRYIMPSEI